MLVTSLSMSGCVDATRLSFPQRPAHSAGLYPDIRIINLSLQKERSQTQQKKKKTSEVMAH